MALLEFSDCGIFCRAGNFYIDPWKKVDRAVITHAHSDHSRWGMQHYLAHRHSIPVMKLRLGQINYQAAEYGEEFLINGVKVSLHPAGHIIGSAQVRVEHKGEVWVAAGDYKVAPDPTAVQFEPVQCHAFITESTFGLPIYKWQEPQLIFDQINEWWAGNAALGKCSIISAYSLGKAQRILASVNAEIGPIYCHGAVESVNYLMRELGLKLPRTERLPTKPSKDRMRNALVICPPSALNTPWMRKLEPASTATASGWMALRGTRRRQSVDRGFVLSDHADFPGLMEAIKSTGTEKVFVTHGYTAAFSRWLTDCGYWSAEARTEFGGDAEETDEIIVPAEDLAAAEALPGEPGAETTPTGLDGQPLIDEENEGDSSNAEVAS